MAKSIFEEIRNRPYAWTTAFDQPGSNCYYKGIELLQRLGILGYAVRGRVGETALEEIVPENIRALYPTEEEFKLTHFWIEAEIDGKWQALDPSFDPLLAKADFTISQWGDDEICFSIEKVYTLEEAIQYQQLWGSPEFGLRYFQAISECAHALNSWLESVRAAVD